MSDVAFLRQIQVLADLSDGLLDRLAEEMRDARVDAGAWLFRKGDEAESLYVIRSGRVEVIAGPPE
jgi:CRP-like cAMP-binding protein